MPEHPLHPPVGYLSLKEKAISLAFDCSGGIAIMKLDPPHIPADLTEHYELPDEDEAPPEV